jgi:hypothetical protein
MGLWEWGSKLMTSIRTGYQAARRVYESPAQAYQQYSYINRAGMYELLWSYYSNSLFDPLSEHIWSVYKSNYSLYRNIRPLYNPTRRLVDFYAAQCYPGALSEDGGSLPDGVALAVPFRDDTPDELKAAIAQFWTWSNWQAKKSLQVRFGCALGDVLIEVTDDLEKRKVTADIFSPSFVSDLTLDSMGNVKAYTLEYQAQEPDGTLYMYKKEVDQEAFRFYKDGEPFDYGNGAAYDNVYGFVPAVWIKPIDIGGDHGSPVIAGSLNKIDDLNNLVSHTHDQIHKVIGAPLVMWSTGIIQNIFNTVKRGPTHDFQEPTSDQEDILILQGPTGGRVESLAGNLNLADTMTYINGLLAEIEQDHPELVFYRELRAMSQVTGPAAERLVGDVVSRVAEVQAAFDQANISLFRMAVAIGGMRANSGAWGPLDQQRAKFAPFDLGSFAAGDLNLTIMPRPLLSATRLESAMEEQAMWTGVKLATDAGVPLALVLKRAGWTDEQVQELQDELDKEAKAQEASIKRAQMLATADQQPPIQTASAGNNATNASQQPGQQQFQQQGQ